MPDADASVRMTAGSPDEIFSSHRIGLLLPEDVNRSHRDALGLTDVSVSWSWQAVDPARARERLAEALKYRHEIAHVVNPPPTVLNAYAKRLPGFFGLLRKCTDRAVRNHLVQDLDVASRCAE